MSSKTIETEIKQLEEYLENRLNSIHFSSSEGSLLGFAEKTRQLTEETEKFKSEVQEFANNILRESKHEDLTGIYKKMLAEHFQNIVEKFKEA